MISGAGPIQKTLSMTPNLSPATSTAKANEGVSFADYLKDAVNKVNELQAAADQTAAAFARGEDIDIHTVMIATEKAALAFNYLVSVRNRLLESYQEIMRMQI